MKLRRVVFVAVPPVQILDLTGPFEVFARCGGYRVELVSANGSGAVRSSSGLTVSDAVPYARIRGAIDTLVVPGGDGAEDLLCDAGFLRWLRTASRRARRTCSVCTGAFVLAAAGLLEGRRAVTHWRYCAQLQRQFPNVNVERDPIFIRQGRIYTSAGITTGIDLALSLVEEDHGSQRALEIARDLVMFLRRGGGQAQFSSLLAAQTSDHRAIQDLQAWILDHLSADLSVPVLARRCRMSPRHFARVFAAELRITPARFVEQTRVEAARALLQSTTHPLKEIATCCGFANPDSMRRSFRRLLGVSPSIYAAEFR